MGGPGNSVRDVIPNVKQILYLFRRHVSDDPETPIREFVSNARDATRGVAEPRVSVWSDGRTISFLDNGCGMDESVIVDAFTQIGGHIPNPAADGETIGQFGVGVLSAFMIATKMVVETRSASDEQGWRIEWHRDATTYHLSRCPRTEVGTLAVLHLDPDDDAAMELGSNAVLREYISKNFALLPVPISVGVNAPAVNGHHRWLAALFQSGREGRLLFDPTARELLNKFTGLDALAAYTVLLDDGPDEKRTRLILGIPRQELKDVHNQKVAFFSKGVFLDCQRPDFLPENLSFIVSLVDSPHFLLQINRERFARDAAYQEIRKQVEGHVLDFLEAVGREKPRLMEEILRTHRTLLLIHAKNTPRLRQLFREHYRFETTAGEHAWPDLLRLADSGDGPAGKRVIYVVSSYQTGQISGLDNKLIVVSEGVEEKALLDQLAADDRVAILNPIPEPSTDPDDRILEPFRRLIIRLGGALKSQSNLRVLPSTTLGVDGPPAALLIKEKAPTLGLDGRDDEGNEASISADALLINIAHPLIERLAARADDLANDAWATAAETLLHIAVIGSPFPRAVKRIAEPVIGNLIDFLYARIERRPMPAPPPSAKGRVKCFVALPFRAPFDTVYKAIESVLGHDPYSWEVIRADEHILDENLFKNVRDHVATSRRFIADISGYNPNVMIELGLMIATDPRGTLMVCDRATSAKIAADINGTLLAIYDPEDVASEDAMTKWFDREVRKRHPFISVYSQPKRKETSNHG